MKVRELQRSIEELTVNLGKAERNLADSVHERSRETKAYSQYKNQAEQDKSTLNKKIRELDTKCEELGDKLKRENQKSGDAERLLQLEIQSLTKTVTVLEEKLSHEQTNHSKQMSDLSNNLKAKLEKLVITQKKTLAEIEESRANECQSLNERWERASR